MKYLHLIALMILGNVSAQEKSLVQSGLLSAYLTYAPSYHFESKSSTFYVVGKLEGYLSQKISISGEGAYYLGNGQQSKSVFNYNNNLSVGPNFHYVRNNNDLSLGFQAGIAFTETPRVGAPTIGEKNVSPMIAPVIGYTNYFFKYFHFFVNARLCMGQHLASQSVNLAELRFAAGLGFNFQSKR